MSKYDFNNDRISFAKFIFQLIFDMNLTEFAFNIKYDRIEIDVKFYTKIQKTQLEPFYIWYIDFYVDVVKNVIIVMIPKKIRKL